jgi:tetratricopeptide (TPR) repeat protein
MANFDKQDYAAAWTPWLNSRVNSRYLLPRSGFHARWPGRPGEVDEAIDIFRSIPKLPPETELLQRSEYEIADCYYKLGQEKEALKRFKSLRTKYPDSKFPRDHMVAGPVLLPAE